MKTVSWLSLRIISAALLGCLLPVSTSRGATSGVNRWTTNGPVGVSVHDIAIDPREPNRLYAAGGEAGLFTSADGGASWNRLTNPQATAWTVTRVAVDPISSSILFAYDDTGSTLYGSDDRGLTWATRGSVGVACWSDPAILVLPSEPRTIYIGNYVSEDGGRTFGAWAPSTDDLAGFAAGATFIAAPDPVQYIKYFNSHFFSFRILRHDRNGFTDTAYPGDLSGGIWSDHRDPNTVYVSAGKGFDAPGLLKTTDAGRTWRTLPIPGLVQAMAIDSARPENLYAIVLQGPVRGPAIANTVASRDAGTTWLSLGPSPSSPNTPPAVLVIDSSGTRLHLASENGVWDFRLAASSLSLLSGRFSLVLDAVDPRTGATTTGTPVSLNDRAGYFSLPAFTGDATFPEVMVKMADATSSPPPFGGSFWFFHASMTDVTYTITVTDQRTGLTRMYSNSGNAQFCGGADTNAFPP